MILREPDFVDIPTPTGPMRVHRFQPAPPFAGPTIILYSEIYQVTGPIRRIAATLAGEGFEVLVPEVYHEFEALGSVLPYDPAGTDRGNFLKYEKPLPAYDSDVRALLDWIFARPPVSSWRGVGVLGFCLGGHLAFRAALDRRIAAAACFYPTDIHSATLGQGKRDDTLLRVRETEAELLLVWGRQDPHIPLDGRKKIYDALTAAERRFQWHEFNAAHAFIRDEGLRHDPALARLALSLVLELFQRRLRVPSA